jgi:HSP20 family protein
MVFRYPSTRHPLHQLRDEVDRLMTGFLGPAGDGILPTMFRGQPPVNVWEKQDAVMVELEAPGIKSDEVDVSVAGGELSIRVTRPDTAEEGVRYHRRERPVGSFSRVVRLPMEVDPDRVEAELRNGVLSITLPKAESAKPRKINVAGG